MTLAEFVKAALKEDIPDGDVTVEALGLFSGECRAELVAKQDLVLSGTEPFEMVFQTLNPKTNIEWKFKNGDRVPKGSKVAVLTGVKMDLLKGERTALNFLGKLSGVATATREFVDQTLGTSTKILDTRKTTPGFRALEKAAVVHGGGTNHRFSLSDAILIKENHIRAIGGVDKAIDAARRNQPEMPIEIEVTNFDELRMALDRKAEKILLDNMTLEEMAEAVKIVNKRAKIEASGNMTLDRIRSISQIGVDYISVGRITHSAPCVDLSLLFID